MINSSPSSPSFDLDINNYKLNEILEMFDLKQTFDESDVVNKKNKLKDKILNERNMTIEHKNNMAIFIDRASFKLISALNENVIQSSKPTHILEFKDLKNPVYKGIGNDDIIKTPFKNNAGLTAKNWEGKLVDGALNPPGYINPINVSTIKRTINIDTRFRANYYNTSPTNFSLTLPTQITNVISMRLASIELPLTYYVVSQYSGNSYFLIEWDYSLNYYETYGTYYGCKGIVKIPDGNYEPFWQEATYATDLASMINTYMERLAISGTQIDIGVGDLSKILDINYTIDRASGRSGFGWKTTATPEPFKVTFGISEDGIEDITTTLQLRLGWLLGFRVSIYEGNSIVSEGVCYMKGPRYAFLCINDYNNSVSDYFVSAFSSSILQKDIIARINLTSIQQTNGVYQSGQDDGNSTQINRQRNYFGPVKIERLEIKLIDEYGRIIDLNNMDWSIALTMECYYAS